MTPIDRPSAMTARAFAVCRVPMHGSEPDPDPGLDPVGYRMTPILHVR